MTPILFSILALDEDNALTPHACIVKYPQFMQPLLSHRTLENAIPTCDLFSFFICFKIMANLYFYFFLLFLLHFSLSNFFLCHFVIFLPSSLWMHIVLLTCKYAQAAKKPAAISCFYCQYCTTNPKIQCTFCELNVGIAKSNI